MRESRSSGSVEGVVSDDHLYSDSVWAQDGAITAAVATTVRAASNCLSMMSYPP
jgi:hypothetical protein